ncbi:MAG: DUF2764 family protein [Lentisphaeria bacterium]
MNYYYLIASLPMLKLEGDSPFSTVKFMSMCEDALSSAQYQALSRVELVPCEKGQACCALEEKWSAFETALRNRALNWVAHKTKMDPSEFLREETEVFATLERRVEDAFDTSNPAQTERSLDRLRWSVLEDLSTGHDFDFEALFVYKIKLMLVEKWQGLSKEEGHKQVLAMVEKILEQSSKA